MFSRSRRVVCVAVGSKSLPLAHLLHFLLSVAGGATSVGHSLESDLRARGAFPVIVGLVRASSVISGKPQELEPSRTTEMIVLRSSFTFLGGWGVAELLHIVASWPQFNPFSHRVFIDDG